MHSVCTYAIVPLPPPPPACLRLPAGASLVIADAHGSAVNVVRWHPSLDHLLLSASNDPHLLLHDLRSPSAPLYRFSGHAPAGGRCAQGPACIF